MLKNFKINYAQYNEPSVRAGTSAEDSYVIESEQMFAA